MSEAEVLKPAVQRKIEEFNRISTSQVNGWSPNQTNYSDSSLDWPPVKKFPPTSPKIRKIPGYVGRGGTYEVPRIQHDEYSLSKPNPVEQQLRKFAMELVDAGVPLPLLEPMGQTILQVEGVMGCHRLRGRRAGSCIYLDVHIEVDPFSSVSAAHDIGETVRHQIQSSHAEVAEVFIHIDPSVSQLSPSVADQQHGGVCPNVILERKDIERIVHDVLSSKFSEIMVVERVTHHSLQSKLLLQIEVSMPSDMLIRNAMEVAKEAEKEILKATPRVNQVCIQLRLGKHQRESYCRDANEEGHFTRGLSL